MTLEHVRSLLSAKHGEKRAIGVHCSQAADITRRASAAKALGDRYAEGAA